MMIMGLEEHVVVILLLVGGQGGVSDWKMKNALLDMA